MCEGVVWSSLTLITIVRGTQCSLFEASRQFLVKLKVCERDHTEETLYNI